MIKVWDNGCENFATNSTIIHMLFLVTPVLNNYKNITIFSVPIFDRNYHQLILVA